MRVARSHAPRIRSRRPRAVLARAWGRKAAASRRSRPTRTTASSSRPTTRRSRRRRARARCCRSRAPVNEALDRCGYPLCKGGVMAMNPRWCAGLDEWKAAFANWIDRGDPESLLAASIFFDFRPLWGERASRPRRLRADVAPRAQANARFLKQMSDNALRNRPPLNWRGELQATDDGLGGRRHRPQDERQRSVRRRARASSRWRPASPRRTPSSACAQSGPADAASRRAKCAHWCDALRAIVQLLRLRDAASARRAARAIGGVDNPNVVRRSRALPTSIGAS